MTKLITLTRGLSTAVDDADYDWLNEFKWCAIPISRTFYAIRKIGIDGRRATVYMHRLLLPGVAEVDHRDRDGLNNQRSNLRAATRSDNARNAPRRRDNTSGYIGVYWSRSHCKWSACITVDGRRMHLGWFVDPVEAARVRDAAAVELHGEFAVLNLGPNGVAS